MPSTDDTPLPALERLDIDDADIRLARDVPLGVPADELLQELIAGTPWRQETVTLFGRRIPQPRLTAWYADAGQAYAYSGVALQPLPWTPSLQAVKTCMETLAATAFNGALLNFYRDQRDSVGLHADDEKELGPEPVIASVSLGATRAFTLRHRSDRQRPTIRIALPHGSVLLMRGATQRHWKHGIEKQRLPCGPRVNLTFRRILPR